MLLNFSLWASKPENELGAAFGGHRMGEELLLAAGEVAWRRSCQRERKRSFFSDFFGLSKRGKKGEKAEDERGQGERRTQVWFLKASFLYFHAILLCFPGTMGFIF